MDDGSWLSWIIIALLILMATYFAACETAFSSVSRIKLKAEVDHGNPRAKKASYIVENFDSAITTILIGTNIVQIVSAAMITFQVTNLWGIGWVTLSAVVTTLALFFVGEMIPKTLAKKYSLRLSMSLAPSLRTFMTLFKPLAFVLTKIGNAFSKLSASDSEITVTEDELHDIIENMKDEGNLDAEQGELVYSALTFADVSAESIVTPRVDVAAINIASSPADILSFMQGSNHSRFPAYAETIDNVVGVLQIRKFIKNYLRQGDSLVVSSVLDDVYFAHQSTKIDELLSAMSHKRVNMAIITDNYGGTVGIVTVEDILEELVGEIWDEDDVVKESCVKLSEGRFELDPELTVEDAFELMDYDDPEDEDFENKLLGEWVYEHFDVIPREGDSFTYHDLTLTVGAMSSNRIIKVIADIGSDDEEGGQRQ